MSEITPEALDELSALERAATPGEWWCVTYRHVRSQNRDVCTTELDGRRDEQSNNDGRLIAALRNAAPQLIAEVRRLREERDEARRDAEVVRGGHWDEVIKERDFALATVAELRVALEEACAIIESANNVIAGLDDGEMAEECNDVLSDVARLRAIAKGE